MGHNKLPYRWSVGKGSCYYGVQGEGQLPLFVRGVGLINSIYKQKQQEFMVFDTIIECLMSRLIDWKSMEVFSL